MEEGRTKEVEAYWRSYLKTLPPAQGGEYEAWSFGDGPGMADRLGALVRDDRKTATCSALWNLEAEGEPLPRAGEKSVILDGGGGPLCIIETTEVAVRRFDRVDERFAHEEGGRRPLPGALARSPPAVL